MYLAWDRKLKREVAIKTLRSELASADGIADRFRREAEAIAQLRHPNIVPVYAVAEEDGVAWFVMPRIDGQTLAKSLESDARWSFADVCRILREAAVALAAAHGAGDRPSRHQAGEHHARGSGAPRGAHGLRHREVGRPCDGADRYWRRGRHAAVHEPRAGGRRHHTRPVVGSVFARPRRISAAHRSPAFEADSLRSLMAMQATVPPTPVRDIRPDAPIGLAKVIERALAKEPTERFASMQEFADALDRVARDVAGEYRRGRRTVPMPNDGPTRCDARSRHGRRPSPSSWLAHS